MTRRKSRQFNFSLHAKINHIEFEDQFLIKPVRTLNIFCQKAAKKFSYKQEKKQTFNDFLRISGRPFSFIFSLPVDT